MDTHALLWYSQDMVAPPAREAIAKVAEGVLVSAASVWEIEIKRSLGRLRAPEDIAALVDQSGFERLPINFEHAIEAGRLPPHHSDPFDRMLVAQARLEGLTIATSEPMLRRYSVATLEVARA